MLARKLGPEAFGIFALAVAFAEFGKILPNAGLAAALPRARQVTPAMADTVFWTSLAVSVVVAGTLALLAGPIAGAFGEPQVAPLLIALGAVLVVSVAGATHIALMLREFGHREMATRSVVSNIVGGGAALAAASAGWGAWSLVVQRGVTELAGTGMAWHAYRWMPGRRLSFDVLRELWAFSAGMTVTQILFVALVRVQDVIIGRTIGTAAVGVYRTAWRTVELIAQAVIMPFSQVALPTLGRLQDDLPAFRRAYVRIISVSAALAFPAIVGFAVLAPYAIPLIFGDQWAESARIARVLGFMALPFTLNRFAGPALGTLGQSGLLAKIARPPARAHRGDDAGRRALRPPRHRGGLRRPGHTPRTARTPTRRPPRPPDPPTGRSTVGEAAADREDHLVDHADRVAPRCTCPSVRCTRAGSTGSRVDVVP